jgi:hypothetical protein
MLLAEDQIEDAFVLVDLTEEASEAGEVLPEEVAE